MDELGIYLLQFDRAGYGESDPNPKLSLKSEASDVQELADQLQLGSKFYLVGVSVGSYPTWSCVKNIPERIKRLAGVALVVPFINYRWPSLPQDLIQDDYRKNLSRCMVWIARHTPSLLHWWLTQEMFPSSSVLDRNAKFFSNKLEVLKNTPGYQLLNNGYEDKVVPVELQRYISTRLPWIKYHEVPDGGHLLVYDSDVFLHNFRGNAIKSRRFLCVKNGEAILRSLLLGEDAPL